MKILAKESLTREILTLLRALLESAFFLLVKIGKMQSFAYFKIIKELRY
jgi:hypothetical protein